MLRTLVSEGVAEMKRYDRGECVDDQSFRLLEIVAAISSIN